MGGRVEIMFCTKAVAVGTSKSACPTVRDMDQVAPSLVKESLPKMAETFRSSGSNFGSSLRGWEKTHTSETAETFTRCWFHIFFIFIPTWGR